jgi:hypothetical protein
MGCAVSATPRPLYARERYSVPVVQEAGWAPGSDWRGAENLAPTGIPSSDHTARSGSLYRLSHPRPYRCYKVTPKKGLNEVVICWRASCMVMYRNCGCYRHFLWIRSEPRGSAVLGYVSNMWYGTSADRGCLCTDHDRDFAPLEPGEIHNGLEYWVLRAKTRLLNVREILM